MHLTNKEILDKLLSYSEDLKHHYNLYQLLLFHFQNKEADKFFGLIEENLKKVHPLFKTVFKTFLKDKEKIVNALQLPYSNAKLEATNNLIKLIKRNAFGFRNFETSKNGFLSLWISKKKGRNLSFLELSFSSTHYSWQRANLRSFISNVVSSVAIFGFFLACDSSWFVQG